jgi:pyrroloquinoline quinone (PQQ) biosynthesis protein C
MINRARVETVFKAQTEAFAASAPFQALEGGRVVDGVYRLFLTDLCKAHIQSPKILAFLYSVAPPRSSEHVKHNLLEELGLEDAEESHPQILANTMKAAGLNDAELAGLEQAAQDEVRRMCTDPFMYGSLREFGLHILLEVSSFEWMLSRLASRMGNFLVRHQQMKPADLLWFFYHSEKDVQHAEEALDTIVDYIDYYGFSPDEVESILDLTFRENVFLRRYFPVGLQG